MRSSHDNLVYYSQKFIAKQGTVCVNHSGTSTGDGTGDRGTVLLSPKSQKQNTVQLTKFALGQGDKSTIPLSILEKDKGARTCENLINTNL